ncbi:MAG TPA: hypothetical protein VHQ47_05305 [Phycisphaerae bacterium]|nr:hypothetical protein [Phycisphaerae bacterium]
MSWKPLINVVATVVVLGGSGFMVWRAYSVSRPETREETRARLLRETTALQAAAAKARASAGAQPQHLIAAPGPAADLPTLPVYPRAGREPQVIYHAEFNQPNAEMEGAAIAPVRRLHGQKGLVHAIRTAPDGKTFASAGSDGTVKIWDIASGKLLQTIPGPTNIVRAMDYSSDGKRIAVGLQGGLIQILDVQGRKVLASWQAHDTGVDGVRFLPGDQQLISTGCDGNVRTWKTDGAALLNASVHNSCVGGLDLFPGGRLALTASFDGSAAIFDTQTGKTNALVGIEHPAVGASVIDHGKQALIYQQTGDALIFDVDSRKIVATLPEQVGGAPCATNADQTLAVESRGHGGVVWSLPTRRRLATLTGPGGIMWGMDMSPDGRWVIAGGGYDPRDPNTQAGSDDTIYIWDLSAGASTASLPGGVKTIVMASGGTHGVYASGDGVLHAIQANANGFSVSKDLPAKADGSLLAISPDATQAAAATGSTVTLVALSGQQTGSWTLPANITALCAMGHGVVGAATGKDLYACHTGQQPKLLTHRQAPIDTLASLGDGNSILFADGPEAALWKEQADHPGMQFSFDRSQQSHVLAIAASPGQKRVYLLDSACGFCLYDLSDGKFLYQFADFDRHFTTMLPGPDDHTVLLGGAGCALLDFSAPAVIARLQGPMGAPIAAAFAPGQALFLGAGGDERTEHFPPSALLPLDGDARALAVAPNAPGAGIAASFRSVNGKNFIVIYDLASGQALRQFDAGSPLNFEQHLTITPDGSLVAFPTHNGVTIVDTQNGHLEQISIPQGQVRAIGFSPDHRTLATTGPNARGMVTLWDIATGQQKTLIQGDDTQIGGFVFSPDGSRLIEFSRIYDLSRNKNPDQGLWIFDAASGAKIRAMPLIGRDPIGVMFSPDGALLYFMDDRGGVQCLDARSFAPRWLADFGPTHLTRAVLSPTGDRLYFWGGAISAIDTASHQVVERYAPAANPLMHLFFAQGQPLVLSATGDDNIHRSVATIQKLADLGTTR